jgi:hypothetical protein
MGSPMPPGVFKSSTLLRRGCKEKLTGIPRPSTQITGGVKENKERWCVLSFPFFGNSRVTTKNNKRRGNLKQRQSGLGGLSGSVAGV